MPVKPICVVRGTGSIGQRHLSILQKSGAVYPLAFPVRPQRRAELKAAGYDVICEWKEAVSAGAEYAIIATDTSRHHLDVIDAGKAGLNVLVEKPMAHGVDSASSCLLAIRSLDRKMWVGCYYRFQKALNNVREKLPVLGRINSVRIECQSYLPNWRPDRPYRESYSARPDEGGVLRDLIHEIDYACWLFGWPENVQAKIQATRQLGIESEDAADMLWETGNGTIVSVRLDYLSRPDRRYLRAYGEHGAIEWDGFGGTVKMELAGKNIDTQCFVQERNEIILAQDMAFVRAAGGQCDLRLATGEDGVRALAICDAAREASRLRREVKVNYLK